MFRKLFYLVSCVVLLSISIPAKADLVITNGDFEVGAGPSTPDVNDWYDNNAGGFWSDAWQSNDSWITPNGSQVVIFSGEDVVEGDLLAGSYLYQSIGTSSGESSVTIGFEWGHPDDTAEGRADGLTVSVLASDGSFVADDANDVLGAAGITLLDSASYDNVALGTDGEIFPVVVELDLSGANEGDEIFLRFNNYWVTSTQSWPILDNVQITEVYTAPTIAWVSYHAADDEPHPDAAAVGFTMAPDIGYTDLLKANGYDVTRVLTSQSPDVEFLNTFDLVIISRTASSGHYSGSGATLWHSVTAPMINLNGYTLRSSRLGFTDGTDMPDTTGDIRLAVTDPTHPIFAGITLTEGVMDNLYAEGAVPLPTDGTISRGISINNNTIDEEGTVLATVAEVSADTGPVGGMVIAEFPAGATMQNSSGSPDDVLAGHRLVFLSGSREPDGVTGGQAAALYDLYPDGEQMFLNAVKYMIPVVPTNPGSDGLIAYYALENDVNDSSGNVLDGVIVGDPTFVEGAVGMGLQLDGVDDYVDLGNDPLFDLTGSEVTLAAWVNVNDIGNGENDPWVGKGDTSYMLKGHRSNNEIEFFIYDGGWVTAHADVGEEFNGEWHHAAGTFDGEQLIIYVDGEEAVSVDYEGVGIVANAYNVAIGTNTQAAGRFSEGIHDEVMIYNRALSEGEILYLAGERAPYIYDGDSLDGWDHDNNSDAWDGTGPGEGAPGGAALLAEDDVTFLRIQDTGDPRGDGFSDPSNRKVYLTQQIDYGLDGTRLEFQLRVATTPPLDNQAGGEAWPEGGIGYHIRDGGKGMVGIAEDGVGQISFSLAKSGEIEGLDTDALVVNGLVGTEMSGDVDTGDSATNAVAIDDATAWNNVVVDIAAGGAGTHVLTVSVNGGDAVSIEVTTGDSMDGENDYVAIGSSGTGGITAFDVDYVKISR